MDKLKTILGAAKHIVVIQADNPDGDSLASALALEIFLSDIGKNVTLYCGVDIPTYLRYMDGWDRVTNELPKQFDASIIVDTSAVVLLENLTKSGELQWIKSKPSIVIDHHVTEPTIDFASVYIIEPAVSTGELLYRIAQKLEWPLSQASSSFIASSILSDSLGLTSEAVTADSVRTIAEMIENGVSLAALDDARKSVGKKTQEILRYKGLLLERVEYSDDGTIAIITIPWDEIEKYSNAYNPSMLVIDEMRMVEGVKVAIAFKTYQNGRVTGKIRTNYGYRIAHKIAEHFGGGGHPYASGFKINSSKPFNEIKSGCIDVATQILATLEKEQSDETLQHTNPNN